VFGAWLRYVEPVDEKADLDAISAWFQPISHSGLFRTKKNPSRFSREGNAAGLWRGIEIHQEDVYQRCRRLKAHR
jgi:hypothetical protein